MNEQTDIEGTIRLIDPVIGTIKLNDKWYNVGMGLLKQALEHFLPGTEVKAGVVGDTIKSLVKQEPRLIG